MPPSEGSPLVEIRRLGKSFRGNVAVSGIDLTVTAGERAGVSGPNGSGKTTLLRCVVGTLTPSEGSVTVLGLPGGSRGARAVTGAVLVHEKAFYQRLTGLQNLIFYAELRHSGKKSARHDVHSLVEELELDEFIRERVDRYSSGMLQQLSAARALLGSPALLVLDEPTRSLDAEAVGRLWGALDRRPNAGMLIASHRLTDLERCTLRIDLA